MKKTVKQIVSGVLLAAVLTACQAAGEKEGQQSAGPLTQEPVTLSVYVPKPQYVEDLTTNAFTLWYEQQTGVHIEWQIATGNQTQAINLMFASGDYPDIIMNCYISKSEQMVYGEQGILLDLEPLIEEQTVYLKQMLKNREDIRKSITTPEGKIYGLPIVNEVYHTKYPSKMWVNQTWLDNLGLAVPQTTEEFYQMLVAFRDRDPNGNGLRDEVPLAATGELGANGYDEYLLNAFIYNDDHRVMQQDGKAVFTANQPDYREGLRYLHRLYSEGLLHKDSLILDRKRLQKMVEQGDESTVGAVPAMWYGIFCDVSSSNRYQEYTAIPPIAGPAGVRQTPFYNNKSSGWDINITSACKQPELAIQWIDWFYSEEGTFISQNGMEGEGWRYAKQGEKGLDGNQAVWARLQPFGITQNKSWMNMGVYYMDERIRQGMMVDPAGEQTEQDLYQATKQNYEPYAVDHYIRDSFLAPDQYSEFTQLRLQIGSEVKQAMVAFISGEKSLDTDWDAYAARLEELGLARYMEIYQTMLEENQ